ncbi:unnamed protein product [Allacma fusca]|uniref:Uncharacterized protein n=1 Tax=Allacma fusca TaxID=39272 RepID=A0A8J2KPA7_9HEXA|nr:unnamed protein product [Allacma fusca]
MSLPPTLVAKSKTEMIIFDHMDTIKCQLFTTGLCHLPFNPATKFSYLPCLEAVFESNNVKSLHKVCKFDCLDDSKPRMTRLTNTKISVAHLPLDGSVLRCPSKDYPLPNNTRGIGNLEIEMTCLCTLRVHNKLYAEPIFPCDNTHLIKAQVIHSIPSQWTRMENLIISDDKRSWNRPEFTNLSFVFNSEWKHNISNMDFTVSSSINDTFESWRNSLNDIEWTNVPDWLQGEVSSTSPLIIIWLTICTLLLAFLMYENTRKSTFIGMLATRIKSTEGYTSHYCHLPTYLEAFIWLILFGMILLIFPKIYRYFKDQIKWRIHSRRWEAEERQRQQRAQEAIRLTEPLRFGDAELVLHETPRPTPLVTQKMAKSKKIQSNSSVAV